MNTLRPAFAAARELARHPSGAFGVQMHAECDELDPDTRPAVPAPVEEVLADGTWRVSVNGKLHNADGPAMIRADGYEEWRQDGELTRDGGPAIVSADGLEMFFYRDGLLHNPNGPAVVRANGRIEHWVNGRLHNTDGPAVVDEDGREEWWLDGIPGTPAEADYAPCISA